MDSTNQDFIVSELLAELKQENVRKDATIKRLHAYLWRVSLGAFLTILLIVGVFLAYLYQYDFSGTTEYETIKTADGMFAVIDSDGNVIGQDMSEDQIKTFMESLTYGESDSNETEENYEKED